MKTFIIGFFTVFGILGFFLLLTAQIEKREKRNHEIEKMCIERGGVMFKHKCVWSLKGRE